jgi:molecular chaperone IbpA
MEVAGANVADGLLTIDLLREIPEAMKPKRIEVRTQTPVAASAETRQLEQKQAA